MNVVSGAVHWAGEHPIPTAVGVFAVGAILLLVLRPATPTVADNGMSAFYAAQAVQATSGNQLMAVQNQDATALGVAQVAAARDVGMVTAQGATDTSLASINGASAVQLADITGSDALATVQNNNATAISLADAAGAFSVATNTVNAQTSVQLAQINADTAAAAELTRQQAQKQQFFLATGEQQIEGAIAPFIMHDPDVAAIFASFNQGGVTYTPAH